MCLQALCVWLFTTVPSSKHVYYLPPFCPYQSFMALCLQFPVITQYGFYSPLCTVPSLVIIPKMPSVCFSPGTQVCGECWANPHSLGPRHWGQPEIVLSFVETVTIRALMLMEASSVAVWQRLGIVKWGSAGIVLDLSSP